MVRERVKKRNGKKEEINYSQEYKWLVDSREQIHMGLPCAPQHSPTR